MDLMICSVCQNEFDEQGTLALPFCSERCRYVDLGCWLNEEYGIPVDDGILENEVS
jgi:endogenous inhibitor of DNA gyrase (YacG/DUF329 family)